jgi:hypothetical protein
MAPYRPRSHQIADRSIARLHDFFVSAGWTVEDLDKDYGEDLLVRIFRDGQATPYSFYIQAKSTDNIKRYMRRNDDYMHYPFTSKHLTHWKDFWEPVILTVWDARADITYWETAQTPEREPDLNASQSTFFIPLNNKLDEEGLKRILSRAVTRHERFTREQEGAQLLVDRLQETIGAKIEYNAQAGILLVHEPGGGARVTVFGKLAERLNRVENVFDDAGLDFSLEESVNNWMITYTEMVEALHGGGKVLFKIDQEENWITSPAKLRRFTRRFTELNEPD